MNITTWITERKSGPNPLEDWQKLWAPWITRGPWGRTLRQHMYERIIVQSSAGVPLREIFIELAKRLRKNRRGRANTEILMMESVARSMRDGRTLAASLERWVPLNESSMIGVAEETGEINRMLRLILETGSIVSRMVAILVGGLAKPAGLLLMGLGFVLYLSRDILPIMLPLMKGHPMTGLSGDLITAVPYITNLPALTGILVFFVACTVFVVWSLPNLTGPVRRVLDGLPPWSMYRRMQGAIWLAGFSALSQVGMPERGALLKMMERATPYLRERLRIAASGLRAGRSVGDSLIEARMPFPDTDTVSDMSIMAGYPNYPDNLARLSSQTLVSTERAITLSSRALVGGGWRRSHVIAVGADLFGHGHHVFGFDNDGRVMGQAASRVANKRGS